MSETLNLYLSTQTLLSLSFVLLWILKRTPVLDFSSLLKLNYFLVFLSVALPSAFILMPGENPFGPIAKVWSEPALSPERMLSSRSINFALPSTALSPHFSWSISSYIGGAVFIFIGGAVIWNLVRRILSFRRMNGLLTDSFSFKKIGSVRVWISDSVETPFSFHNGRAHIVLPHEVLSQRTRFRIALAHELQHHRHRDTLWIYFFEAVRSLFGVNPLVNKTVEQTMELQELACDEVLVGRNKVSPHQYGECLHAFAEKQWLKLHSPIGAVGMAIEAKLLKRRIENMFQGRTLTSKKTLNSLIVLSLLAMTGGAWTVRGAVSDQRISMQQAQSLVKQTMADQEIPVVVDANVLYWLNKAVSTESSRKHMRESLDRMEKYKEMIADKLKASSLPTELLAVPLVESGFQNDVRSSMNAAGIWQFIPQTARRCGLKVNTHVDERLNAGRLTEAAVCYYQKLHAIFKNWHAVLSAYNVGERRVLNAMDRAGHRDVLKLAQEGRLGDEGKNYLPKVIAGMIIMKNPELVK